MCVKDTRERRNEERRVLCFGEIDDLVNLLNSGTVVTTGPGSSTPRSTAGHATGHTGATSSTVEFHHDGVGDALKLLLLLLVLLAGSSLALVEPGNGLVDFSLECFLVGSVELLVNLRIGEGVAERVSVRLEAVLGANSCRLKVIFLFVLLSLSKHALNFFLTQTALVVGDDNLVGLAGTLLKSRDVHDTVGIKIEGNLNLGNTAWGRRDTSELELAHQIVVLGALALTLVDLDQDAGLVVGESGEDLRLLCGNSGVAGNELGHHTTSSLDTERQWRDVEQQDLVGGLRASITAKDSSLDSGTVGNSLIRVDGLVGLLAVEVVGDELLDTRNTSGATDENNLVDLGLVDLSVGKDTVDGLKGGSEEILAQLLETSTGDGSVEVDTLEQGVDLNGSLSRRRKGTLGTLAGSAETAKTTGVAGQIPVETVSNEFK